MNRRSQQNKNSRATGAGPGPLSPRERRTEFIKLRVTPRTKKMMRRDAELLGMTMSELLIQAWEQASERLRGTES